MRLIAGTMALWSLIALSVCAARVFGVTQPAEDRIALAGFDECDGQPCFMGIVPGVTLWQDAQAISGNTILSQSDSLVVLDYRASRIQLVKSPTQGSVTSLIVDFSGIKALPPTIGSFVDRFGPPCSVWTLATSNASSGLTMLLYPSMSVQPVMMDSHLSLTDPVKDVLLIDSVSVLGNSASECSFRREGTVLVGPWSGFASVGYYQQHGPVN